MYSFAYSFVFSLALAAISCGGSSSDNPDQPDARTPDARPLDAPAPDDAAIDAPPNPPATLTIDVLRNGQQPVFVRYRTKGSEWKTPVAVSSGYQLAVQDEFLLVAVCGDASTGFEVGYDARAVTFSQAIDLPCAAPRAAGTTFAVTGTMVQAGTVSLGGATASSTAPNWTFTLDAAQGAGELIAVSGDRVLIRRGLNITAPGAVATVDMTAGSGFTSQPFDVRGAQPGDTVTATTSLFTHHGLTALPRSPGTTARLVPGSLLQPNEGQFVRVNAEEGPFRRSVEAAVAGTAYTLLSRLDGVQFTADGAVWTRLPMGHVELTFEGGRNTMRFFANARWILLGNTSLVFDTNIPGFLDAWKLPATVDARELTVERVPANSSSRLQSSFRDGTPRPAR